MTAPKNKKQKSTPVAEARKGHKLFWILLILLVIVGIGLITPIVMDYRNDKAIAVDRARFEQADKDVQAVAEAIAATVGVPYKKSENKHCSRPSVKWEEAALSCVTSRSIFFNIPNEEFGNIKLSYLRSAVDAKWEYKKTITSDNLSQTHLFSKLPVQNYDPKSDYQMITYVYLNNKIKMDCDITSIMYRAPNPPFEDFVMNNSSEYLLAVNIDCADQARETFFPLKD